MLCLYLRAVQGLQFVMRLWKGEMMEKINREAFIITKAPAIRGKLRQEVLRRFADGVRKELKEGENVQEIFKQAADDGQSRRRALEIAGKMNAGIHCGHWQSLWNAQFDIMHLVR